MTARAAASWALLACALLGACAAPPAGWREVRLAQGQGFLPVAFGGDGEVRPTGNGLMLDVGSPLTGVVFHEAPPAADYEVRCVARKVFGNDFFCGLTFPVPQGSLTLVLGGWGGAVCGLSCLDGEDAAANETRTLKAFAPGRAYEILVRVRRDRVEVAVDGQALLSAALAGRRASLRPEVELCGPYGFCCYATRTELLSVGWRALADGDAAD